MAETAQVEITIPAANTAAAWNEQLAEAAKKAGVELPKPAGGAATAAPVVPAPTPEDKDGETVYKFTVETPGGPVVITDTDPAKLLEKVSVATAASQQAPVTDPGPDPKKQALDEAAMFDLKVRVMNGDVTAFDEYLEKSGAIDKYLEKKGIPVATLKADMDERATGRVTGAWQAATAQFMEKARNGEIDYPLDAKGAGAPQNMQMIGFMIADLGLKDSPSLDSLEKAWNAAKERGLMFQLAEGTTGGGAPPVVPSPAPRKRQTSSTAIGSGGGQEIRKTAPAGQVEIDLTKLNPRQMTEAWNTAIAAGYKPEQIVIKQ